jgi:hypothetical protein
MGAFPIARALAERAGNPLVKIVPPGGVVWVSESLGPFSISLSFLVWTFNPCALPVALRRFPCLHVVNLLQFLLAVYCLMSDFKYN